MEWKLIHGNVKVAEVSLNPFPFPGEGPRECLEETLVHASDWRITSRVLQIYQWSTVKNRHSSHWCIVHSGGVRFEMDIGIWKQNFELLRRIDETVKLLGTLNVACWISFPLPPSVRPYGLSFFNSCHFQRVTTRTERDCDGRGGHPVCEKVAGPVTMQWEWMSSLSSKGQHKCILYTDRQHVWYLDINGH